MSATSCAWSNEVGTTTLGFAFGVTVIGRTTCGRGRVATAPTAGSPTLSRGPPMGRTAPIADGSSLGGP